MRTSRNSVQNISGTDTILIGSLDGGKKSCSIFFEVKTTKNKITVKTFEDMTWTKKANYSQHKVHGKVAVPEFTGLDDDTVSFSISFSAFLGVNPEKEMVKLEKLRTEHKVCTLIIGPMPIGNYYVTDVTATRKYVSNYGEVFVIDCTIKLLQEPYPPGYSRKNKTSSGDKAKNRRGSSRSTRK